VLGICEDDCKEWKGGEEKRREERSEDTYNHSNGDESEKTEDDPHGRSHGLQNQLSFGLNTPTMTNRF